jgi:hypothetical protein
MEIIRSFIPVAHDNSSTIKNGFQKFNDLTFQNNAEHFKNKLDNEEFNEGGWQLRRRRKNSWD